VHRVWAYLLVLIFGFSPVAPALLADDSANLPACCRRLGRHHCELMAAQFPVGVALKGVCDLYGRFPAALAPPECAKAAFCNAPGTVSAALASRPAAAEQSQALYRVSFGRSRQKRGPPSLNS